MKLLKSNTMVCYSNQINLFWLLIFSQIFHHSSGFFFPLVGNFFSRLRNNNNQENGGVSVFSGGIGGSGNATSIRVPMFLKLPERRFDVLTSVVSTGANESDIKVQNNVSTTATAAEALLNSKLVVPTSTSVTTSISSSQQRAATNVQPHTLTAPFTPNLFGMMSYMHALKDIKRNYKDQEKERKIELFSNKGNGDLMSRIMRTLIQKVVNKYQKHTEILKLKILKRQDKLQNFLQLPMVSHVISSDQTTKPVLLRRDDVTRPSGSTPTGKRFPSILDAFLI